MKRFYTPALRITSLVVLLLFSWSFGGIIDIAYAIKYSDQLSVSSASADQPKAGKTSAEKFNSSLNDIEQILAGTADDTDAKKNKIRNKRSEIAQFDNEIRKQFKETERKLRDAGLPQEIIKRHKDFVKHYEDNLNELNANLDAVDNAKTDVDTDREVEKLRKFLKKANPPKKHIPLDPNKLPHRTPDVEKKEPRTKPEEFEPPSKLTGGQAEPGTMRYRAGHRQEPIMVASIGSLTGILSSALVQAAPPSDADLAETIEVQFTPDITAKAEELENNPVKIYNWVRNNIEFVPTYGSIQGADYCLQTKLCNAFDTASLLIALLRVSGIYARYVEGTVEIPIEKVMNWAGGFSDANAAIEFIATGGIPGTILTSGGKIVAAQMEHIWVEAWVDMIPSQGAVHRQGDMWVPLDASFKQYNYTEGIDIKSEVPFDAESFVDQLINTATINEEEGSATGVDSLFINQTMTDYQTQVENYITQNYPDATVGDVFGKKEIIKQEFPVLLGTLPYKQIIAGTKYGSLPDNLRHKVTFSVSLNNLFYDATPLIATKTLPELAGKKITLSYSPATQADEDVINSYLPEPHDDGTPIDPSELPTSLPAYLINLKPKLRVDGAVVATGGSVMMGLTENFVMSFAYPGQSSNVVSNLIEAGEYLGIAFDLGRISEEQMLAIRTKLVSTKIKLETHDFTGLTKDDILGDLLYTTALSYYAELDTMNYLQAKTMGVNITRLPSENIFSFELDIATSFYDIPMSVTPGGLAMDVDHNIHVVKAFDGDNDKKKQFMLASGMNSSALEHSVPEQLFSTPEEPAFGISAVKALKIANDQGIPIHTINKENIDEILPQLQINNAAITDIQNAINTGKEVAVSKVAITYYDWTGVGYIIIDPNTGAGAYMISGGMSGAQLVAGISMLRSLLLGWLPWVDEPSVIVDSYGDAFKLISEGLGGIFKYWGDHFWCVYSETAEELHAVIASLVTLSYAIRGIAIKEGAKRVIGIIGYVILVLGAMQYFYDLADDCAKG